MPPVGRPAHAHRRADVTAQLKSIGKGDLPTIMIDPSGKSKSMAVTFEQSEHGGGLVLIGLFAGELAFNDPNFHRSDLTLCASRNALPGTFRDIMALVGADKKS